MIERAGLALLHRLDPERGHGLALGALRLGLVQGADLRARPMLAQRVAGLSLPNPLGLAAGFDKNAVALSGLARQGFGFLEVGAATPRPQPGNPQPRLFRLSRDHAVINRFGFNNDGADAIAARLAQRPAGVIVGLNIGANKDSADRAADFAQVLRRCGAHVDFATVNVSSPNTEKLRALQGPAALRGLLAGVMEARAELARPCPIFLKIAPDLNADEISELAGVATEAGIDAVIATNTTLSREGLTDPQAAQAGGLSGRPLFERSTRVLALLSQATGGQMPLIGVGGVESAETAYAKIKAGACAVQLYSALVYQGFSLTGRILDGLEAELRREGYTSLTQAIGTGRGDWL